MIAVRAAIAVALLAVVGCSPAQSPETLSTSTLTQTKCADLIVLGARGATQSASKNYGSGTEVRRSVTEMAERLHDRTDVTVRLEGVPYPAEFGSAYTANVFTGVKNMNTLLTRLSKSCPDSRFGLVGFSQGAQIVHGFAVTMTPSQISRVVLVAMISDPRRNPDDDIASWSYADSVTPGPGKLGAGTLLPEALRSKAISLCVEDDEICNWPPGGYSGPLSDTHRRYYEQPDSVRSTGEQLDIMLKRNGF